MTRKVDDILTSQIPGVFLERLPSAGFWTARTFFTLAPNEVRGKSFGLQFRSGNGAEGPDPAKRIPGRNINQRLAGDRGRLHRLGPEAAAGERHPAAAGGFKEMLEDRANVGNCNP